MKKIIAFSFLLISLNVFGQDDRRKKDSLALFAPTAVGEPYGEKISREIGKAGGGLVSSDGKVELLIPQGALTSNVTISIQSITNFAQGGVSNAFRLEPSGTQFLQPVQLIFHYSDKEMEEGSSQLMGIAYQNEKGLWYGLRNFKLDTVSKTITGNITHFSDWSKRWRIILTPEKKRVKVSNEIVIFLSALRMEQESDKNIRLNPFRDEFDTKKNWFVNGTPNGNSSVGHIQAVPGAPPNVISRIYKAPAQVPDQNPVEITVELSNIKPGGADSMLYPEQANVMRKCKVTIYDNAYEVKMESVIISGGKGVWGGITTRRDEGSFYVSLDKKKPEILNIQNMPEVMKNNCRNVLLNPTTCTGLLHVAGVKDSKVTPANPPGQPYPIVEIWFVPVPMELSRVRFDCPPPGKSVGNSTGVLPPMRIGRAFPYDLKFSAKEGEQILINSSGEDGSLKVWVQKVKEE